MNGSWNCTAVTGVGWDAVGNRMDGGVQGADTDRDFDSPQPTGIQVRIHGHVVLNATFAGAPPSTPIPLQLQQSLYGSLSASRSIDVLGTVVPGAGQVIFDYSYDIALEPAQSAALLAPHLIINVSDKVADPAGGAVQFQSIEDMGAIEVTYSYAMLMAQPFAMRLTPPARLRAVVGGRR